MDWKNRLREAKEKVGTEAKSRLEHFQARQQVQAALDRKRNEELDAYRRKMRLEADKKRIREQYKLSNKRDFQHYAKPLGPRKNPEYDFLGGSLFRSSIMGGNTSSPNRRQAPQRQPQSDLGSISGLNLFESPKRKRRY